MNRLLSVAFFFCLFISCTPEYKPCNFESPDVKLKLYHDALTELVEQHFYNLYLGEDEERLFKQYVANMADSVRIDKEAIRLQNKLFKDSTRFCTLYLDTAFKPRVPPWQQLRSDTSSFALELKNLLRNYSGKEQAAIDSLNQAQSNYPASSFSICTFNLKPLTQAKKDKPRCAIGKVVLSNAVMNREADKALIYYELECGGNCGKGELLLLEKVNSNWEITQTVMLWIS